MNTNIIKSLGLIALGGVVGGLTGYFLASLVINQLLEQQEYFEEEEESINIEVKTGTPETVKLKKVEKRDYTKYAKEDLAELVKPYTTEGSANSKQDNIRVISLEEYESNRTVNRELITYYAGDTTFCDATEEIIPNPEDFFGANVHLHFGEESQDPDIVYVRNENNGVNYEITQVPGKYSVIIMGLPDDEPKSKPKGRRSTNKTPKSFESEENEGED